MFASDAVDRIVEELEFIEAERHQAHGIGLHFRIVYRLPEHCGTCASHGEVVAVSLVYGDRLFHVSLGITLLQLFDYIARHNNLAQTAKQIENGIRADGFSGLRRTAVSMRGIPRRYIRIYINRIRAALGLALRQAELEVSPHAVLVSTETATNETGYRLRGTFEWLRIAS